VDALPRFVRSAVPPSASGIAAAHRMNTTSCIDAPIRLLGFPVTGHAATTQRIVKRGPQLRIDFAAQKLRAGR